MSCYHPMIAYRSATLSDNGKRPLVFGARGAYTDLPVYVPCGRCIGCRLEKARQWAVRCMHEAQMWDRNCFVTLTYNDDNLPIDRSVNKREMQLFMKRLRKEYGEGIRFYGCGEYGSKLGRPHYHMLLFNHDFPDKEVWKAQKARGYKGRYIIDEFTLYRSESLERLWPYGFSTIGDVTFESAGYCARYVTKKIYGEMAEGYYDGRIPEFAMMSRGNAKTGPQGIGRTWIEKYGSDVYPKDFFTMKGRRLKPPKYYDTVLENEDPELYKKIKNEREVKAIEDRKVNGPSRLIEREKYKLNQITRLRRSLENEKS